MRGTIWPRQSLGRRSASSVERNSRCTPVRLQGLCAAWEAFASFQSLEPGTPAGCFPVLVLTLLVELPLALPSVPRSAWYDQTRLYERLCAPQTEPVAGHESTWFGLLASTSSASLWCRWQGSQVHGLWSPWSLYFSMLSTKSAINFHLHPSIWSSVQPFLRSQ